MPIEQPLVLQILLRCHLFRGIDSTRLEAAAKFLVERELSQGTVLYQQGDDPDAFYFVYSGKLKLYRRPPGAPRAASRQVQIGCLEEGDYFGQEVLANNWPRQVTVEADTDVIVLRLGVPDFMELIKLIPSLGPRLQLILDEFRLMLRKRWPWLDKDEYVYYIARKHVFFLVLNLLAPLIFGGVTIPLALVFLFTTGLTVIMNLMFWAAVIVTVAWAIWNWVDWSNDYYLVTNRRILNLERVVLLYDSRQEAPIEAIQSTTSNSTQVGRIVGYGNVAIRTFIGTILFRGVHMPDQVLALVQDQQLRAQAGQRRTDRKKIETMVADGLVKASQPVQVQLPPQPKPAEKQKTPEFQVFLSEMFHLRYEANGAIIYRTHWWILLKKIWLPSLILFALLFLLITRLANLFNLLSIEATLALVLLFGLIIGIWWGYQYMDWHNDIYLITADQVVDVYKKPLGAEQRDAAPLKNILSIEYKRVGLTGLLLNFGTVYIRVGDKELTFDEVYNPSGVQRELFDKLSAKNYAERQAESEKEGQRMAEWLAAYDRVRQQRNPPPQPPSRGGF